ncbi:MAG: hypothetical protein WCQ95_11245 [Bacteroidota bacterium]
MKYCISKIIVIALVGIAGLTPKAFSQKQGVAIGDFYRTAKLLSDSMPKGWTLKTDTSVFYDLVLQTRMMELEADMTTNDGPNPRGVCEVRVRVLKWVSPSIYTMLVNRNAELKAKLPPQNSKENLQTWFAENDKTLKILDAEPTHFDTNYSYRIWCQRQPKQEADKKMFDGLMALLNRMFTKYKMVERGAGGRK